MKMRLWTSQTIEFYNELMEKGIAYCTRVSEFAQENDFAYRWIAEQTRKRIGEPPMPEIKLPVWAWYQYDSAKSNKPPKSPRNIQEGVSAYMEIELPDNEVVLSEYNNWHAVLNLCPLTNWKRIGKKTDLLDKKAGRLLDFNEYPIEIQKEIENSWEAIFDLDRRDKDVGRKHKRNRSIQATFWMLKLEHIISIEFLERKGNVVKRICFDKNF